LYWRNANGGGAIISMIAGMATWGIFEIYPLEVPSLVPALIVGFVSMVVGSVLLRRKEFKQA
jgi:Na+/pantothenate symporter